MLNDLVALQEEEGILEGTEALHSAMAAHWKEKLRDRLVQFNVATRLWFAGRPEGAVVPQVVSLTAAADKFCRPVREALRLWAVIDAGPPPPGLVLPLGLPEGFARADLEGLLADYHGERMALEEVEFQQALRRAARDARQDRVREALVAYNGIVNSQFGEEGPEGTRPPRLFPLPGSTPEPVVLHAAWEPAAGAARLTWEASASPRLKGYQLRWHPGPEYQRRGSAIAATFAADAPREFLARHGLGAPGAVASFCLYVVQARGRHKGSRPVAVRRPPGG